MNEDMIRIIWYAVYLISISTASVTLTHIGYGLKTKEWWICMVCIVLTYFAGIYKQKGEK